MAEHCILLTRQRNGPGNYHHTGNEKQIMELIASLYEDSLSNQKRDTQQLQYRLQDVIKFIDKHEEFVMLKFSTSREAYLPCDKEYIKRKLQTHFISQMK